MIKQFEKNDIDTIMKIWKDNNQKFQKFIDNQYWIDNYVSTKDEFLKSKIYIYTEATKIKAFIVINNGKIINIQVMPEIQREGIGKILIQKVKKENSDLFVEIYEKNTNAILFFKAMGFRNIGKNTQKNDNIANENVCQMCWNQENVSNANFIYFDNSISEQLINKYDKLSNIQFYNIHTYTHELNNIFNINIANSLEKKNDRIYISDYIDVRNKINSIIKNESTIIFFDCDNDYSFLYNVIKDVVKVKNANLKIIMHKPFAVEGGKKTRIYEDVRKNFEDFNIVDVDYEAIGQNLNVSFKDAFEMRDEELLKMICK